MGKRSSTNLLISIGYSGRIVLVAFVLILICGCISKTQTPLITVNSLDNGEIPLDTVGNFDIYTESFLITNPSNRSFEDVAIDIKVSPTAAYCHGLSKTFTFPELVPNEKKTVQLSITEFADLGCQYNYTYQIFVTDS